MRVLLSTSTLDPPAAAAEPAGAPSPAARRALPPIRKPAWHTAAERLIGLVAFSAVVAIFLIFLFVGREALPIATSAHTRAEASPRELFTARYPAADGREIFSWQPVSEHPKYSLWPLVAGTLKVTLVAILIAVPLAVGSAVYVALVAPPRVREALKPVIELLAGIPSVVLGFFALIVLASWLQDAFGFTHRLNATVAGAGLALAVIPIIFTIAEDALRAVPDSYRQASLALGASPWQTTLRVMVPAASPGIAAAIALGFGRAVGETMIVLMASGNAAIFSARLDEPVRTLSATVAAELAEVVFGSPHYSVLFLIGALLFAFTFAVNLVGNVATQRLKRRLGAVRG
jgi:phosphate transport system permease protein